MNGQVNQAMKTPSQSGTTAGNVFGVSVSGWSVTYDAGTGVLTGKATVTPDAGVTLASVGIGIYPPSLADNSMYASGIASPATPAPGPWSVETITALFNPQTEGNNVVSTVLGQSSRGFYFFQQSFTV
jgi:hypothetical protein